MKSLLIIHLTFFILWSASVQTAAIYPGHIAAAFQVDSRETEFPARYWKKHGLRPPPPRRPSQFSEAPTGSAEVEQPTFDLEVRQSNHFAGPEYSVAYNYKKQGNRYTEIDPIPENAWDILKDEVSRTVLRDGEDAEDVLEGNLLPRNPKPICKGKVCVPNRPTDKPRAVGIPDSEVSAHNNAENSVELSDTQQLHASWDHDKKRRTVPNGWIVTLKEVKSP